MTKPTRLWIKIEVDSGNAAAVEDPEGAVDHVLDQVRATKPYDMSGARHLLRDTNGNRIGRFWIQLEENDDDSDCDDDATVP